MKVFNSGAIGVPPPPPAKEQESTGGSPALLDDRCNRWLPGNRGERVAKNVLATLGAQEADAAQFAASCHFDLFASP